MSDLLEAYKRRRKVEAVRKVGEALDANARRRSDQLAPMLAGHEGYQEFLKDPKAKELLAEHNDAATAYDRATAKYKGRLWEELSAKEQKAMNAAAAQRDRRQLDVAEQMDRLAIGYGFQHLLAEQLPSVAETPTEVKQPLTKTPLDAYRELADAVDRAIGSLCFLDAMPFRPGAWQSVRETSAPLAAAWWAAGESVQNALCGVWMPPPHVGDVMYSSVAEGVFHLVEQLLPLSEPLALPPTETAASESHVRWAEKRLAGRMIDLIAMHQTERARVEGALARDAGAPRVESIGIESRSAVPTLEEVVEAIGLECGIYSSGCEPVPPFYAGVCAFDMTMRLIEANWPGHDHSGMPTEGRRLWFALLRATRLQRLDAVERNAQAFIDWLERELNVERPDDDIDCDPKSEELADDDNSPECPVFLGEMRDGPIVNGVHKDPLLVGQYKVIESLIKAGPKGLKLDALKRASCFTDARGILERLAASDPDWDKVIYFPGKRRDGYKIRFRNGI